jgi:hypothetical protein
VCLAAIGAAALACAPSAAGQGITLIEISGGPGLKFYSQTDTLIGGRLTGRLVVAFHGARTAGCALHGMCGYSGTEIWTPAPRAAIDVDVLKTNRAPEEFVDFDDIAVSGNEGGVTAENTEQTLPSLAGMDASGLSCADADDTGGDTPVPVRHERVEFNLAQPGLSSLIGTRCAGPLTSDVASAFPTRTVPLTSIMRGDITIDLSGRHPFASHGFAGTVDSTLALRLGRPGRPQVTKFTESVTHQRRVVVHYHAVMRGALEETITGDSEPALCGPLGSCGLEGTQTVSTVQPSSAEIWASSSKRLPNRDYLVALGLRSGRRVKGIAVHGQVSWSRSATLSALMIDAGTTCADSAPIGDEAADLQMARHKISGQLYVGLYGTYQVRTRCPGPLTSTYALASGRATWSSGHLLVLPLTTSTAFTDDGYRGRVVSHLILTLSRPRVVLHPAPVVSFGG